MKKVLIYIAALLLSIFILDRLVAAVLDKFSGKVMVGETGGKINHYLSLQNTPSLLIVGPSAPTYQINPANFPVSTYNIGHANTDDCFQAGVLSILEQSKKLPKNIMLYVSAESYYTVKGDSTIHSTDASKLKAFYGKNQLITQYINEIGPYEKYKYFFHLSNYNNRILNLFKNLYFSHTGNYSKNGYFPFPVAANDSITTTLDYNWKITHMQKGSLAFNPSGTRYLMESIAICKRNNCNLIVFNLPSYSDFFNLPAITPGSIYIDSVLNANKIIHFNFRSQLISLKIANASMWKDVNHLNEKGAKIESDTIAKLITPFLVK